jgi:beta-glucosidase
VENTRLGIPVDWTNEGIRGLKHPSATSFPAQCGQGSTWNKELIARIGEVEGKEAAVCGWGRREGWRKDGGGGRG